MIIWVRGVGRRRRHHRWAASRLRHVAASATETKEGGARAEVEVGSVDSVLPLPAHPPGTDCRCEVLSACAAAAPASACTSGVGATAAAAFRSPPDGCLCRLAPGRVDAADCSRCCCSVSSVSGWQAHRACLPAGDAAAAAASHGPHCCGPSSRRLLGIIPKGCQLGKRRGNGQAELVVQLAGHARCCCSGRCLMLPLPCGDRRWPGCCCC